MICAYAAQMFGSLMMTALKRALVAKHLCYFHHMTRETCDQDVDLSPGAAAGAVVNRWNQM